jgi:hypothetical protein
LLKYTHVEMRKVGGVAHSLVRLTRLYGSLACKTRYILTRWTPEQHQAQLWLQIGGCLTPRSAESDSII